MDNPELRAQLERCHLVSHGWALVCCAQNEDHAEEVLQEAYLKVLDGRAVYRAQASFQTWLFAVIRKTAAAQRRRLWFRELWLARYAEQVEPAEAARGSDELLDQSHRQKMFQAGLARLSRRQREVLHLVFYQDLSLSEAAVAMDITIGAARKHYERGKHALRTWIEDERMEDEVELTRAQAQGSVPRATAS